MSVVVASVGGDGFEAVPHSSLVSHNSSSTAAPPLDAAGGELPPPSVCVLGPPSNTWRERGRRMAAHVNGGPLELTGDSPGGEKPAAAAGQTC